MSSVIPTYYTSIKPFCGFFEAGTPCLTYHKIGPRPQRVRIKGLYLSPQLFEKQTAELADEGFKVSGYDQITHAPPGSKQVALAFDDGFLSAFENAMTVLAAHQFRAIQFLVVDRIGQFNEWEVQLGDVKEPLMDKAHIQEWLAAGHAIGAHTLTHPFLTRVSLREAREEIFSGKKKLEDMFGLTIRHFCYPYGDWNESIRDLVQDAGYQTACTTEFGLNTARTNPFELKRIMARHRSLSIKALKARLAG